VELILLVAMGTGFAGMVCSEAVTAYRFHIYDEESFKSRKIGIRVTLIAMILSIPITIAVQHIQAKTEIIPSQEKIK